MAIAAARPIVVIVGRTRAGKTTLATALHETLAWPAVSFSAYIRAEASKRGLDWQRKTLQDLGAAMVTDLGPMQFVRGLLDHADLGVRDAPFVVEGFRYLNTLTALRALVKPTAVRTIYLQVSDVERNRRLATQGVSVEEGERWEEHETERDVLGPLKFDADLVIDADQPASFVAKTAVDWLAAS